MGVYKVVEWIDRTLAAATDKENFHYLAIGRTPAMENLPILLLEGDRTGEDFQSQGDI